jgi:catechol 2,3-dioxygenase-like lactoylglutathione lyase family enzyme
MNLNQVTLPVSDIPSTVSFYQQLGFNLIVDTDHYARFECPEGDSSFSLSLHPSVDNHATIYFEHQDLDEWVEQLIRQGVSFEQRPRDQPYLWREAVLRDPSGNRIILYWAGENRLNPPWRVN